MNTTLRTRLLLAISSTIVVTLSVTQYGMYVLMRRQLVTEFDQALAARVRAMAVLIEQDDDDIRIQFQQYPMQEFARSIRPEYYQVWHEDGRVLARSRQLKANNLIRLNGDRVVPLVRALALPDGRRGRAAGIRFRPNVEGELPEAPSRLQRNSLQHDHDADDDDDDALDRDKLEFASRPFVTLVVARDTDDMKTSLAGLRWLLAGSGVFATGIILGILAWLVTHNLWPLHSLANQISKVNEQTLDQRFTLENGPGELDPVVARLNTLMTCLETAFLREKTFTADVAHELRTPLAGIRSTLEVSLSRHRDCESYRSSIQKCLRISEETETVISTLLSLSRIEAGHATLETDIIDLCHLLQQAWRPFASRLFGTHINMIWDLNERLLLRTDPGKLHVVITNLLDNAISYVNNDGEVVVSTFLDEFAAPHLRVTNTGCQLTADQIEHVCDRFWRADTARSATGVHSGLGLALVSRIVLFLDGKFDITVIDDKFVADIRLPESSVEYINDNPDIDEASALRKVGSKKRAFFADPMAESSMTGTVRNESDW